VTVIIQPLAAFQTIWAEPPFGGMPAAFGPGPMTANIGVGNVTTTIVGAPGEIYAVNIDGDTPITAGFARCRPTINGVPLPTFYTADPANVQPLTFRVLDTPRNFQTGRTHDASRKCAVLKERQILSGASGESRVRAKKLDARQRLNNCCH